jgi:hypothetical protein
MASTAAIQSTPDAVPRRRWRFSLGGLFRAITICSLAMFAVVQLGPLAAARDLGIGLAIALVIWAWAARSFRLFLAAGLLALLGCIPTILAEGAPFSKRTAVCLECGMTREMHEVCGWTTKDEISESEASRWAAPLVPAGHVHAWTVSSNHSRTHWFGSAPIGCGGPGEGAMMAWQLARLGDPAGAEKAYLEYQAILTGRSPKPMAVHSQELQAAIAAAVQAKQ